MLSVVVSVRVNAISRASDVSIVFPPLYADCSVEADGGHLTTLSELSIQSVELEASGVVRPGILRNEFASVTIVTPFVPDG